ncbi:hypothetical protein LCGC14_0849260 [marine sediment metagenome]|uniref:S-adenosylmethionine decarboxylase proenzyme n=1 Tax=marine sediment metagenome TaxID=412755 RepID=A0A0F9SHW0_9ZZZZ
MSKNEPFGLELLIDLSNCNVDRFNRKDIERYFIELCELIDMERHDLHFWDYEDVPESDIPYDQPHLIGTSAVQFITTSNIIIHTLDIYRQVFIDVFSCKKFSPEVVKKFTEEFFAGKISQTHLIERGTKL